MKNKNNMHQGVGLLIGNKNGSQFFVQQKDDTYPHEVWRGCLSFWGGAIEQGESPRTALARELEEEIPESVALLADFDIEQLKTYTVHAYHGAFELTVFEVKVTDEILQQLTTIKVLEGEGVLLERAAIENRKWIWETDFIFAEMQL